MVKKALMGIENEFRLLRRGETMDGSHYFPAIVSGLPVPYFQRTPTCVRLATGGSFYMDGSEPEVTTAPFYVEPGAVSGLAGNLFLNLNVVLQGLKEANAKRGEQLYLQGYSAHYSFTFPQIAIHHEKVCRLLAATVNPAIQLLVENRKSSGVMFRYREHGRVEICGDFVPSLEDTVVGVGFQAALLSTLDTWLEQGATVEEIQERLRYHLPAEQISPVNTRQGYILRTPQVIKNGRKAVISVQDSHQGLNREVTAQEMLEYFTELCAPAVREILSPEEQQLLYDSILGKRKLSIDCQGYPQGYAKVVPVPVDPQKSISPLTKAFGHAVEKREVQGRPLESSAMSWEMITFRYGQNGTSRMLYVPLDDLVPFDRMVEMFPELLLPLAEGKLTDEQKLALQGLGIDAPEALLVPPVAGEPNYNIPFINDCIHDPNFGEVPSQNIISYISGLYRDLSENSGFFQKLTNIQDSIIKLRYAKNIEYNPPDLDLFQKFSNGEYFSQKDIERSSKYPRKLDKNNFFKEKERDIPEDNISPHNLDIDGLKKKKKEPLARISRLEDIISSFFSGRESISKEKEL